VLIFTELHIDFYALQKLAYNMLMLLQ